MSHPATDLERDVSGFRTRILISVMLVVGLLTVAGVLLANARLSRLADQELQASIEQQIRLSGITRGVRQATLADICATLSRKPRLRASLEDGALDLLYPSARDELQRLARPPATVAPAASRDRLRSRFYRFLDAHGSIIDPKDASAAGTISASLARRIEFDGLPTDSAIGYFLEAAEAGGREPLEVFATPIFSTEFYEPIAALVVGFPLEPGLADMDNAPVRHNGVWIDGVAHAPSLSPSLRAALEQQLQEEQPPSGEATPPLTRIDLGGEAFRLSLRPMNLGSAYPPAHELFLASLSPLRRYQNTVKAQIIGVAIALLLGGLALSNVFARRLAKPVEALAEAKEEEHWQRLQVEDALDHTSRELERAARFSADASHQLKTPVTALRAGLESLLEEPGVPETVAAELHDMIRQTGRLSNVIDDLLLLSRLDAGRLRLDLKPENLRLVIDELLDDLSILPNPRRLTVAASIDPELRVEADRRYIGLILQNLLENARKYNRLDGRIQIEATVAGGSVACRIGNTGTPIPASSQAFIFDRFHRGASGENVPGYGLGLNLAHELAALHGGKLALLRSQNDWTEFELTLRLAAPS